MSKPVKNRSPTLGSCMARTVAAPTTRATSRPKITTTTCTRAVSECACACVTAHTRFIDVCEADCHMARVVGRGGRTGSGSTPLTASGTHRPFIISCSGNAQCGLISLRAVLHICKCQPARCTGHIAPCRPLGPKTTPAASAGATYELPSHQSVRVWTMRQEE